MKPTAAKPGDYCPLFTDKGRRVLWITILSGIWLNFLCLAPMKAAAPDKSASGDSPSVNTNPPISQDPMAYQQALTQYLDRMKHRILGKWNPPMKRQEATTTVSFKIHRDGTISDITITKGSEDKSLDDLALSTLQTATPLEPLPPEIMKDLVVDFSFSCTTRDAVTAQPDNDLSSKEQAMQANPNDPRLAFEYGRALRFAGQAKESVVPLKRAIELGFVGCEPMVELSLAYKKLGQVDEAEQILKQAIVRNANFATSYKVLGDLLYEQKRWDEAANAYSNFLQIQPDGPLTSYAQIRLELSQRHGESTDADE